MFHLNKTQHFHTASAPGVSSIHSLSVTCGAFLSQSTTSSATCSYNNIIYSCVLQQLTLTGSTVQDIIFSIPHLATALLRNMES
jgi:hypothetical protein